MSNARSNSILIEKKPFRVMITIVTLVAFFVNIFSYDLAWAARTPSELTGVGSDRAGGPDGPGLIKKELSVDTFRLPEYMGYIKDSWSPAQHSAQYAQRSTIIHIQDAHCNYAAQQRIAEIVAYLNKEYGIDTVNLEGGAKNYDLSLFTSISDKNIRKKASDYFVKEGLVNGAEYFAVNNPEKITLWGIEDTGLYIDNLKVYRNSLKYKDEVDRHIKALTHILNNLKTKIYSEDLMALDARYWQYKAGTIEFKDYLAYLIQAAKGSNIDIKKFTNIYLLSQTLGEEEKISFKRANNERDDLIDRLQKKLSKKSLEELVLKTVEYRSEKISQKDFYAYLTNKAGLAGISLNDFPELQNYIVYISMYNAIDKMKIMDEMDRLEDVVKASLYKNYKQRELDKLSKNLAILKNIFDISLTKEDYKYYLDNERSFDVVNYTSFIDREAPLYNITARPDSNIANLDRYREDISKFYEYSFKRDDVFVKNIRLKGQGARGKGQEGSRVKGQGEAAILVTGGFHTENLCEKFRKQGISYISIMPTFTNCEGYDCPYFKILSGQKNLTIKEALPAVLSKALATLDQLSPAMMEAGQKAGLIGQQPQAPGESVRKSTSEGGGEIKVPPHEFFNPYKNLQNVSRGLNTDLFAAQRLIETLDAEKELAREARPSTALPLKKKVLVIGAGVGRVIYDLRSRYGDLFEFMPINKEDISIPPEYFLRHLQGDNAAAGVTRQDIERFLENFHKATVIRDVAKEGLGVEDGSVDYIFIAQQTMLYIEDPLKLIGRIKKALKPGGSAFICNWDGNIYIDDQTTSPNTRMELEELISKLNALESEKYHSPPQYEHQQKENLIAGNDVHELVIHNFIPQADFPELPFNRELSKSYLLPGTQTLTYTESFYNGASFNRTYEAVVTAAPRAPFSTGRMSSSGTVPEGMPASGTPYAVGAKSSLKIDTPDRLREAFADGSALAEGVKLVKEIYHNVNTPDDISKINDKVTNFDISLLPFLVKVPKAILSSDDWGICKVSREGIEYRKGDETEFVAFKEEARQVFTAFLEENENEFFAEGIDKLSRANLAMLDANVLKNRGKSMVAELATADKEKMKTFISESELMQHNGPMQFDMDSIIVVLGLVENLPKMLTAGISREDWYWIPLGEGIEFVNRTTGEKEFVRYAPAVSLSNSTDFENVKELLRTLSAISANRAMNSLDEAALYSPNASLTAYDKLRLLIEQEFSNYLPLNYDHYAIYKGVSRWGGLPMADVVNHRFTLHELKLTYAGLSSLPPKMVSAHNDEYFSYRPNRLINYTQTYPDGYSAFVFAPLSMRKAIMLKNIVVQSKIMMDYLGRFDDGYLMDLSYVRIQLHEKAHGLFRMLSQENRKRYGMISWNTDDSNWDELRSVSKNQKDETKRELGKHFLITYPLEKNDSGEDFADHFTAYVLFGPQFRAEAQYNEAIKKKYEFFKEHVFSGQEYADNFDFTHAAPRTSASGKMKVLDDLMSKIHNDWTNLSAYDARLLLAQAEDILIQLGNPEYVNMPTENGGTTQKGFAKELATLKEVIGKEIRLLEISAMRGRPFIPSGTWLAPNLEENNDQPNLYGHVTGFRNLYEIIFNNNGVIRGSPAEPIFVNPGGRGQAARARLNYSAGVVPIVLDKGRMLSADLPIVLSKAYGEGTFVTDIPLKFATTNSKAFMWQAILTELEYQQETLTAERELQLAGALGFESYTQLRQELSAPAKNLAEKFVANLPAPVVVPRSSATGTAQPAPAIDKNKQAEAIEFLGYFDRFIQQAYRYHYDEQLADLLMERARAISETDIALTRGCARIVNAIFHLLRRDIAMDESQIRRELSASGLILNKLYFVPLGLFFYIDLLNGQHVTCKAGKIIAESKHFLNGHDFSVWIVDPIISGYTTRHTEGGLFGVRAAGGVATFFDHMLTLSSRLLQISSKEGSEDIYDMLIARQWKGKTQAQILADLVGENEAREVRHEMDVILNANASIGKPTDEMSAFLASLGVGPAPLYSLTNAIEETRYYLSGYERSEHRSAAISIIKGYLNDMGLSIDIENMTLEKFNEHLKVFSKISEQEVRDIAERLENEYFHQSLRVGSYAGGISASAFHSPDGNPVRWERFTGVARASMSGEAAYLIGTEDAVADPAGALADIANRVNAENEDAVYRIGSNGKINLIEPPMIALDKSSAKKIGSKLSSAVKKFRAQLRGAPVTIRILKSGSLDESGNIYRIWDSKDHLNYIYAVARNTAGNGREGGIEILVARQLLEDLSSREIADKIIRPSLKIYGPGSGLEANISYSDMVGGEERRDIEASLGKHMVGRFSVLNRFRSMMSYILAKQDGMRPEDRAAYIELADSFIRIEGIATAMKSVMHPASLAFWLLVPLGVSVPVVLAMSAGLMVTGMMAGAAMREFVVVRFMLNHRTTPAWATLLTAWIPRFIGFIFSIPLQIALNAAFQQSGEPRHGGVPSQGAILSRVGTALYPVSAFFVGLLRAFAALSVEMVKMWKLTTTVNLFLRSLSQSTLDPHSIKNILEDAYIIAGGIQEKEREQLKPGVSFKIRSTKRALTSVEADLKMDTPVLYIDSVNSYRRLWDQIVKKGYSKYYEEDEKAYVFDAQGYFAADPGSRQVEDFIKNLKDFVDDFAKYQQAGIGEAEAGVSIAARAPSSTARMSSSGTAPEVKPASGTAEEASHAIMEFIGSQGVREENFEVAKGGSLIGEKEFGRQADAFLKALPVEIRTGEAYPWWDEQEHGQGRDELYFMLWDILANGYDGIAFFYDPVVSRAGPGSGYKGNVAIRFMIDEKAKELVIIVTDNGMGNVGAKTSRKKQFNAERAQKHLDRAYIGGIGSGSVNLDQMAGLLGGAYRTNLGTDRSRFSENKLYIPLNKLSLKSEPALAEEAALISSRESAGGKAQTVPMGTAVIGDREKALKAVDNMFKSSMRDVLPRDIRKKIRANIIEIIEKYKNPRKAIKEVLKLAKNEGLPFVYYMAIVELLEWIIIPGAAVWMGHPEIALFLLPIEPEPVAVPLYFMVRQAFRTIFHIKMSPDKFELYLQRFRESTLAGLSDEEITEMTAGLKNRVDINQLIGHLTKTLNSTSLDAEDRKSTDDRIGARETAAKALGRLLRNKGSKQRLAYDALVAHACNAKENEWVRKACVGALGKILNTHSIKPLMRLVNDPNIKVATAAIRSLSGFGPLAGTAVYDIVNFIQKMPKRDISEADKLWGTIYAVDCLGYLCEGREPKKWKEVKNILMGNLDSSKPELLRAAAAESLSRITTSDSDITATLEMAAKNDDATREIALWGLVRKFVSGDTTVDRGNIKKILMDCAASDDSKLRAFAISVLRRFGGQLGADNIEQEIKRLSQRPAVHTKEVLFGSVSGKDIETKARELREAGNTVIIVKDLALPRDMRPLDINGNPVGDVNIDKARVSTIFKKIKEGQAFQYPAMDPGRSKPSKWANMVPKETVWILAEESEFNKDEFEIISAAAKEAWPGLEIKRGQPPATGPPGAVLPHAQQPVALAPSSATPPASSRTSSAGTVQIIEAGQSALRTSTSGVNLTPEGAIKELTGLGINVQSAQQPFFLAHAPEILIGAALVWITYRILARTGVLHKAGNFLTRETSVRLKEEGRIPLLRAIQAAIMAYRLVPYLMIAAAVILNPADILNARYYFISLVSAIVAIHIAGKINADAREVAKGAKTGSRANAIAENLMRLTAISAMLGSIMAIVNFVAAKALPMQEKRDRARMLNIVEQAKEIIEENDQASGPMQIKVPGLASETGNHDRYELRMAMRENLSAGIPGIFAAAMAEAEGNYKMNIDYVMRYKFLKEGSDEEGKKIYERFIAGTDGCIKPERLKKLKFKNEKELIENGSYGDWEQLDGDAFKSEEDLNRFRNVKFAANQYIAAHETEMRRFVMEDMFGKLSACKTLRDAALVLQKWNGMGYRFVTPGEMRRLNDVLTYLGYDTDYKTLSADKVHTLTEKGIEGIGEKKMLWVLMAKCPVYGARVITLCSAFEENQELVRMAAEEDLIYRLEHGTPSKDTIRFSPEAEKQLHELAAHLRKSSSGEEGAKEPAAKPAITAAGQDTYAVLNAGAAELFKQYNNSGIIGRIFKERAQIHRDMYYKQWEFDLIALTHGYIWYVINLNAGGTGEAERQGLGNSASDVIDSAVFEFKPNIQDLACFYYNDNKAGNVEIITVPKALQLKGNLSRVLIPKLENSIKVEMETMLKTLGYEDVQVVEVSRKGGLASVIRKDCYYHNPRMYYSDPETNAFVMKDLKNLLESGYLLSSNERKAYQELVDTIAYLLYGDDIKISAFEKTEYAKNQPQNDNRVQTVKNLANAIHHGTEQETAAAIQALSSQEIVDGTRRLTLINSLRSNRVMQMIALAGTEPAVDQKYSLERAHKIISERHDSELKNLVNIASRSMALEDVQDGGMPLALVLDILGTFDANLLELKKDSTGEVERVTIGVIRKHSKSQAVLIIQRDPLLPGSWTMSFEHSDKTRTETEVNLKDMKNMFSGHDRISAATGLISVKDFLTGFDPSEYTKDDLVHTISPYTGEEIVYRHPYARSLSSQGWENVPPAILVRSEMTPQEAIPIHALASGEAARAPVNPYVRAANVLRGLNTDLFATKRFIETLDAEKALAEKTKSTGTLLPKKKVLVIGAGAGRVIYDLHARYGDLFEFVPINKEGISVTPEDFLESLQRDGVGAGVSLEDIKKFLEDFRKATVICDVGEGLGVEDGSVDHIFVAQKTMLHIENPLKLVGRIKKALKVGGSGFICDWDGSIVIDDMSRRTRFELKKLIEKLNAWENKTPPQYEYWLRGINLEEECDIQELVIHNIDPQTNFPDLILNGSPSYELYDTYPAVYTKPVYDGKKFNDLIEARASASGAAEAGTIAKPALVTKLSTSDDYIRQVADHLAVINHDSPDQEYNALKTLFAQNSNKVTEYLVYVREGKVLGFITYFAYKGDDEASVMDILVFPESRMEGVGRTLWQEVKKYAQEQGAKKIMIKAILDQAREFWEKILTAELQNGTHIQSVGGINFIVYLSEQSWEEEQDNEKKPELDRSHWSVGDRKTFDALVERTKDSPKGSVHLEIGEQSTLRDALSHPHQRTSEEAKRIVLLLDKDSQQALLEQASYKGWKPPRQVQAENILVELLTELGQVPIPPELAARAALEVAARTSASGETAVSGAGESREALQARIILLEGSLKRGGRSIETVDPARIINENGLIDRIRKGEVVLRIEADTIDHAATASHALTEFLARNFCRDFGVDLEGFTFVCGKLIRNAFLNGNKLDFSLPVYIYLDIPNRIIEVWDLAKEIREDDAWERMKSDAEPRLGGLGIDIDALNMKGWSYRLDKDISNRSLGGKLGSMASVSQIPLAVEPITKAASGAPRASASGRAEGVQAIRALDKSYFGFEVVDIYKEVLKDKEILDLLEQIFTQTYTKFLGEKGANFIKEYFKNLRALSQKKNITSEEIRQMFLGLRDIFERSGLKPIYYGEYRNDNLRKSIELAGSENFHGYVVDLGADDNALGENLLELYGGQIEHVEGIDIEERSNVRKGPKLGFTVQDKDSQTLPVEDGKADVVIIRYALHHMSFEQQENFLKETRRILKPGGRAIIYEDTYSTEIKSIASDQNEFNEKFLELRDPYRLKLFLAANDTFSQGIKDKNQPFPFTYRTIEEWQRLFEELGFTDVATQYFGTPIYDLHQAPFGVFVLHNGQVPVAEGPAARTSASGDTKPVTFEDIRDLLRGSAKPRGLQLMMNYFNTLQTSRHHLEGPALSSHVTRMLGLLRSIRYGKPEFQEDALLPATKTAWHGLIEIVQKRPEYYDVLQQAILWHDIGKGDVDTRKGHAEKSVQLIKRYYTGKQKELIKWLVANHMKILFAYQIPEEGGEVIDETNGPKIMEDIYASFERERSVIGDDAFKLLLTLTFIDRQGSIKKDAVSGILRPHTGNFNEIIEWWGAKEQATEAVSSTTINKIYWGKEAPSFASRKARDYEMQPGAQKWLKASLESLPSHGSRIFEIGCGDGALIEQARNMGYSNILGTDLSADVIKMAHDKRGIPEDNLKVIDVTKDSIPGGNDLVIASDVLLYMYNPDSPEVFNNVMNKLRASLSNNGILSIRWAAGNDEIVNKTDRWVFLASKERLKNLMSKAGFEVVSLASVNEPIYGGDSECEYWYLIARKSQAVAEVQAEMPATKPAPAPVAEGPAARASASGEAQVSSAADLNRLVEESEILKLISGTQFAYGASNMDYNIFVNKLNSLSTAPMTMDEFVIRHGESVRGGYALGVGDLSYVYDTLPDVFGLIRWHTVYMEHDIDTDSKISNTYKFLETITADNRPIVFFVPPSMMGYRHEVTVTNSEMRWLFDNPDKLKNVLFVFGAYDYVPKEQLSPLSLTNKANMIDRVVSALRAAHPDRADEIERMIKDNQKYCHDRSSEAFRALRERIRAASARPGTMITRESTSGVMKAVGEETIEVRQAVSLEALSGVEGKDNIVKIIVALPSGVESDVMRKRWASKLSNGLGKNGFGIISADGNKGSKETDSNQIIPCFIYSDEEASQKSLDGAIGRAREQLEKELPQGVKGHIVVFAPQIEGGLQLAAKAQETYKDQKNITVVPDAYSDLNLDLDQNKFPDIMIRVALGRNIAFYYTGQDPGDTLTAINELLVKVADGFVPIVTIDDLFNLLKPLRIRAINYNTIRDWQNSQELVASAA